MNFKRTLLAAALPLMFTFTGAAQALQLKFADIHPAGYPTVIAEENMGKTLTRETNGELTFQYFPGGVLGSEKEVIEQMQVGAVQLSRVSLGIVGPVVPDVNVFNMPFIFRDHQHMRNVIDGAVGDEILDKSPTPNSASWRWPGWTAARATSTPRNRYASSKISRA